MKRRRKKATKKSSYANHPVVWITGFVSAIIGIFVFLTGRQALIQAGKILTIANAPLIDPAYHNLFAGTNISPRTHAQQSFIPVDTNIRAVEVYVESANKRESDMLKLTVSVNNDSGILAVIYQEVSAGFSGWVRFDMPDQGLVVSSSSMYYIWLSDTGKISFFWLLSDNYYPDGEADFRDVDDFGDKDFLFKIY